MKLSELGMHCGECEIIDYCNSFEDTPPCAQPRFENMDTKTFLKLAESSKRISANAILNDVARKMGKGEWK